MSVKVIVCALFAGVAALSAGVVAGRAGDEPDRLCQMLFDEYVIGRGMINASTVHAAAHIVAERGRTNGFWRNVLAELRSDDERSELRCVSVLGKMLELDAAARDRSDETTGSASQGRPSVLVGAEVLQELLARGAKADRLRADEYVIALVRARVPEACEHFRVVLRDEAKQALPSTKFHAAVGLAQCAEPAGFEWLVANTGDPTPTVSIAAPGRVASLNLDVCCIAALQELSGKRDLRTRQDCEAWWKQVDRKTLGRSHVELVEQ